MNETLPPIDEASRSRFEQAWANKTRPRLEDHLPDKSDPRYLATLEELVCVDLEFCLRDASSTSRDGVGQVEDYLERFPQLREPKILQRLLLAECETRGRLGQQLSHDEYEVRFPGVISESDIERMALSTRSDVGEPIVTDSRIGRYKLLQKLGEGGFGEVYLAEQSRPVRRRVAVKVIKPGMDSRAVLARFEAERQALALMDHPNIARVFDAGATEQGRPFVVMELIKGIPITDYCDRHQLNPHERIALLISVLNAVQHAHQKGVIHRDIKPSNILVAAQESGAVAKVIDFGVAKAIEQPLTERTMFTQYGQVIGTPQYMSPEQAEMNALDVDTRSDIYSLGVLLYELLTGTTPIPLEDLRELALDKMLSAIRDVETAKPSTRLSQSQASLAAISKNRRTEPKKLGTLLKGDLDWIVMKSLEKDRTGRYESAAAFADDLTRYLQDEPVLAGPPTAAYRLKKYARKYRRPLMAAACVGGLLIAATVVTSWSYFKANRARIAEAAARQKAEEATRLAEQRLQSEQAATQLAVKAEQEARHQAEIASAVTDFVTADLLAQADPSATTDRDITLRQVLDRAAIQLGDQFTQQPRVEAAVRQTIGNAYRGLGEYPVAETQLRQALKLMRRELGEAHAETLRVSLDLAALLFWMSKNSESIDLFQRVVETASQSLGERHAVTLDAMNGLAEIKTWFGRLDAAIQLLRRAEEIGKSALGERHATYLTTIDLLANAYRFQGKLAEAERLLKDNVQRISDLVGDEHPETLFAMEGLGELYLSQMKIDQAEAVMKQVYEIRGRTLGPEHHQTLSSMNGLGVLYRDSGQCAQAAPLLEESLELVRKLLGHQHSDTLMAISDLGELRAYEGRLEEAKELFTEALENGRVALGDEDMFVSTAFHNLGWVNEMLGNTEQAEEQLRAAIERRAKLLGADHPYTLRSMTMLAGLYKQQGCFQKAVELLEPIFAAPNQSLEESNPDTWFAAFELAWAYDGAGRVDQAENLFQELIGIVTSELGPEDPEALNLLDGYAWFLLLNNRWDEADTKYREVVERRTSVLGRDHFDTQYSIRGLLLVHYKKGELATHDALSREALEWAVASAPDSWALAEAQLIRGLTLAARQNRGEAEKLLLDSFRGLEKHLDKLIEEFRPLELAMAAQTLVELYELTDRPEEAERWKQELVRLREDYQLELPSSERAE